MTFIAPSTSLLVAIQHIALVFGTLNYLTPEDFTNAGKLTPDQLRPAQDGNQRIHDMRGPGTDQLLRRLRARRGAGVTAVVDKWPNGRVPYVLSDQFTITQRAIIARAMSAYATRTCVQFVAKTASDTDYVYIAKIDGCYADFARVGGRQEVSLANECVNYPTVIHELMHVVGFIHEHQRNDRDGYVSIQWRNIIPGASSDFVRLNVQGLSYYGEPYDYFSIMHYESAEGSANGMNTIEAKQSGYTPLLGKGVDFSQSDLRRVNAAYNCPQAG
uniref:Metalloendopeptidase n=1 Tax=Plectus sambesii TaxID=2011161 RepID=A0A914WFF4_9BILA